jgi:copper(I)-binding protein
MVAGAAAVYLDIASGGDADDRLVAARVPADVAASVELHETYEAQGDGGGMADDDAMDGNGMADDDAMDGNGMTGGTMGDTGEGMGMMSMREVPEITVPAGATVSLEPGGLHIMLLDLVADLEPGDEFELTLVFAEAGEVTLTVDVREQV